jgi:hypothetical protein
MARSLEVDFLLVGHVLKPADVDQKFLALTDAQRGVAQLLEVVLVRGVLLERDQLELDRVPTPEACHVGRNVGRLLGHLEVERHIARRRKRALQGAADARGHGLHAIGKVVLHREVEVDGLARCQLVDERHGITARRFTRSRAASSSFFCSFLLFATYPPGQSQPSKRVDIPARRDLALQAEPLNAVERGRVAMRRSSRK